MRYRTKNKRRETDIYEKYRRILRIPRLANKEVDEMRKHIGFLAQTVCEHVWGKKLY